MRRGERRLRPPGLRLLAVLALALAACAGPVQAIRTDPKIVHADLARSAVATREPSLPTRNVLFEQGLFDRFAEDQERQIGQRDAQAQPEAGQHVPLRGQG